MHRPMQLMVMLTLIGSFMALTGIILHSISRIMHECQNELVINGRESQENRYIAGMSARDNQAAVYGNR